MIGEPLDSSSKGGSESMGREENFRPEFGSDQLANRVSATIRELQAIPKVTNHLISRLKPFAIRC